MTTLLCYLNVHVHVQGVHVHVISQNVHTLFDVKNVPRFMVNSQGSGKCAYILLWVSLNPMTGVMICAAPRNKV